MTDISPQQEFYNECKNIQKSFATEKYVLIEEFGSFVGILRDDGAFAGNYDLQQITHIDQILSFQNDDLPKTLRACPLTSDFWSEDYADRLEVFEDEENITYLQDVEFSYRFGDQHDNIVRKLQQQEISFDGVFDLMVGPRRTARVFDKKNMGGAKAFAQSVYVPVVLQADVDFDLVVEKDGTFVWSTERVGSKGDTVLCCNNYVDLETPSSIRSFRLNDDEFVASPLSLKDRLEDNRKQSSSGAPPKLTL